MSKYWNLGELLRAYESVFGPRHPPSPAQGGQLAAVQKHFPSATTIADLVEVEPGKYEVSKA